MRPILFLLLAAACSPLWSQHIPEGSSQRGKQNGPALELWLAPGVPFWSWNENEFMKEAGKLGFRWLTKGESARAAPPKGTFFGETAYECVVNFKEKSPTSVTISYFNRGDSDQRLSESEFKSQVSERIRVLTQRLRTQPMPGNQQSRINKVRDESRVWQVRDVRFELAYSYTPANRDRPFRAEYIQLRVKEFTPGQMPASAGGGRVNPYEIRKRVQRDTESGDVWISQVPMVDQGPKGYCAAATSERILRYFGQEVDQHQVAQVANTTSGGGTGSTQLREALQAVGRQYDFKLNKHMVWDWDDFQKQIANYNRVAKSKGKRQVSIPKANINVSDLYSQMDGEVLKTARQKERSEYEKFKQKIRRYVDGGCPLAWSVTLGFYKEEPMYSGRGGHMRLIIGYNSRTDEVIFSDSWGSRHAKKRLPMDEAFAMTKALLTLEPQGLRL